MLQPNTAYRYEPGADRLFLHNDNSYPTVHLPVARFIGEAANPTAPRPVYEGASNLANFTLRRAIDAHPETHDLLEQRKLWLIANFSISGVNIDVDLQVHQEYFSLRAGRNGNMPRANWRYVTGNVQKGYEISYLHEENPMLFDYTGEEESLLVAPQVYDHAPTNAEYLRDPALNYAYRFWGHERTLVDIMARKLPGFEQHISVDRTASL